MPPPRESSAENQTPTQIASGIESFISRYADCAVLEDGKLLFDLASANHTVSTAHDRCTLQLWNEQQNLVRRIVSATERNGTLRLDTLRFGQSHTKLLELVADRKRKVPAARTSARELYLKILERVLKRSFPEWKPEGFRTAMDLERSFGPAYARGVITKGNQAWAIVGVNEEETTVTIDGILTVGILWLHTCREQANGRKIFHGLRLILPRGTATLTLSRLAWMNPDAARWDLWEMDQTSEELTEQDAADQGNLRTRLVHHPDESAAKERFVKAVEEIMALVPHGEEERVDQHLRSISELAFLLHGLEFARARIGLAPGSFARTLEITVGAVGAETLLAPASVEDIREKIAELFARRRPLDPGRFMRQQVPVSRRIGAPSTSPAHARMAAQPRHRGGNPGSDPLYRAAPERWLESMLRRDLAPLTRSLAPQAMLAGGKTFANFANELDPDTIGNRADPTVEEVPNDESHSRIIPRLDPRHVYAQVPAIAGASDRGLLDLLGVTADGRLAVIELKTDEDLHLALQGLDYWVRVRHHNRQPQDAATGLGEFQRLGYFRGVELSPLPPRLYLVAPALHVHPATEIVLRYLSPKVEWSLLALDERWRQQIRVVWRRQSGAVS